MMEMVSSDSFSTSSVMCMGRRAEPLVPPAGMTISAKVGVKSPAPAVPSEVTSLRTVTVKPPCGAALPDGRVAVTVTGSSLPSLTVAGETARVMAAAQVPTSMVPSVKPAP